MSKHYDAPCMHTAEHVLNSIMVRHFGCERCFSSHINPGKSKCDYHFPRPLQEEERRAVEDAVNAVLRTRTPVSEEYMPREEAAEAFNLSRLPSSTGDMLRIIRIGEYDACPCIGRHAANTADVGAFHIISHEWNDGVLRIRFKLS